MKITGRYAMRNIQTIIREIEHRLDGYVWMDDVKDTKLYDIMGRRNTDSGHWADSRFFVAEIAYYKEYLSDIYKKMNDYDGNNAEYCLYELYKRNKNDERFLFRFKTQVRFDGQGGFIIGNRKEQYDSPRAKLKNTIRQLFRILFPNIWF